MTTEERKLIENTPPDANVEAILLLARALTPKSTTGMMLAVKGPIRPSHNTIVNVLNNSGTTTTPAAQAPAHVVSVRRGYNEAAYFGPPPHVESTAATLHNNNLLTAALCLARELDTPSLEKLIATAKDVIAQRSSGGGGANAVAVAAHM